MKQGKKLPQPNHVRKQWKTAIEAQFLMGHW